MSTIVVTPPAAAARVAVAKPSHSVRPGSLTCTWVSTMPGMSTSSEPSTTSSPDHGRIQRQDGFDPLAVDEHGRRPQRAADHRPLRTEDDHALAR